MGGGGGGGVCVMEKVEEDGIYVCLGLALLIARKHSMTSQSRHLGHAL